MKKGEQTTRITPIVVERKVLPSPAEADKKDRPPDQGQRQEEQTVGCTQLSTGHQDLRRRRRSAQQCMRKAALSSPRSRGGVTAIVAAGHTILCRRGSCPRRSAGQISRKRYGLAKGSR